MNNSLDIIIINWNSGDQLRACLQSIQDADRTSFRLKKVVVVDNASHDDSINDLPSFNYQLEVIKNLTNRGFGAASNQAAKLCDAAYILFLNPDTRLFPKALRAPMEFMIDKNNAHIGLCSVQNTDENGTIKPSCFKFPREKHLLTMIFPMSKVLSRLQHQMLHLSHEKSSEVECFSGAFLLIRRSLFEQLGGYDERYFVFFEDFDLAYRAYKKGYKSYFLAQEESQIYHKHKKSASGASAIRLLYTIRSRIIYGFLHFKKPSAILLLIASLTIEPMARTGRGILRGSTQEVKEVIRAYLLLVKALPDTIKIIRSV